MLSICVLAYNHPELLLPCLNSILVQDIPCDHELLIIDNGSTPPLQVPAPFLPIRLQTNRGNIGGQNACFEASNRDWVLFVANDVRLLPACVSHLFLNKHPGRVSQPMLYKQDDTVDSAGLLWRWPGYGFSAKHKWRTCHTFSASCYLMRKSIWTKIGGFDESLISSHEDIDFGLYMKEQGYNPAPLIYGDAYHLGNQTLKHTLCNPSRIFHAARIQVIRKHYQGVDRALRLASVTVLDGLHAWYKNSRRHSHSTHDNTNNLDTPAQSVLHSVGNQP